MKCGLPQSFKRVPLLRSYARVDDEGNLLLVEVRGDRRHKVQAEFNMQSTTPSPGTLLPIQLKK
jgi:hypothetical protein